MEMILLCIVYTLHTVSSLNVTVSGQTYIEPGVPYIVSCTVNEYRDSRSTIFTAILTNGVHEQFTIGFFKLYGCYQLTGSVNTVCNNASCSCDDNGLTTQWTHHTSLDLNTPVTFTCYSTDNYTKIVTSKPFQATIPYGPGSSLIFNSSSKHVTKVLGQDFSVICFADCKPTCRFQWTTLTSVVSTGAMLHIPKLLKDDIGTYTCRAENGYGTGGMKALYLTVNYGPDSVTLFPPNTQYAVTEGNTIPPISCTADCRPVCNYMWSGPNVPVDTTNVLSLQNISRIHKGDFSCTVSNDVGSLKSSDVNMNVLFGPGFSAQFEPSTISVTKRKGDKLGPIICSATCNPLCQYTWTKPDKTTINAAQLIVSSLSIEDHGPFICTASNGIDGSQNKSLNVTVNYAPQSVTLVPTDTQYTVIEGNTIPPISCTADCRPVCNYTWSGRNVTTGTTNILSFQNISRNQRGVFNCTATNNVRSVKSSNIYINVKFGPGSSLQFDSSDTLVTKEKGDKLGPIRCKATCNPLCEYKWTKPDKSIINDGELTIESLSIDDYGTFICTASNGIVDSQSKSLHVTVNYGPESVILSPPAKQYTLTYGQTNPPINCTADCRPVCQYMWSGLHVPSGDSGFLSLQNIQKNQSGDYICTASNEVGSMQTKIKVNVLYEPSVNNLSINGKNFTVKENNTVILSCNYEGNPAPTITWQKNNIILSIADENKGRSFYTIQAVRCKDNGNYSCVANNSLGLSSVQQSLFVTCFPRLNVYIQQPPRRIGLSIGEKLNLTVNIIAYPKLLKANWTFQPSTSSDDERSNNYTTSLKSDLFTHVAYFYKYHLKKDDFGNYTLKIQNDIGGIAVHFYVDRAGLPDPPTDLLVICETSPMVVLWKPGFNGGTPQWFTVIWTDLKTNTSMVRSSIPDTDNGQYVKVTTSSLSDATTYSINVEANNKYGRVRATIYDNCTTKSAQFIQSENSAAVGVGAGIGTSLLILILAAIVVFIFKRSRRRKNTEGNAIYEATQSGSRELSANEDHLYNDLQQCQGDNTNKHRDPATYANLSF